MTTINIITAEDIRAEFVDEEAERELAFYERELAHVEAEYDRYIVGGGDDSHYIADLRDDMMWLQAHVRALAA